MLFRSKLEITVMSYYKSKRIILLIIDMVAIILSYVIAIGIRYNLLVPSLGSVLVVSSYSLFFLMAIILYTVVFFVRRKPRIDRQSNREIIISTIEQQIVFVGTYVVLFFVFKKG